ncbi:MAG: alpha-amylase family glycosyl hydrolase [Flavobacteriales bacterium]
MGIQPAFFFAADKYYGPKDALKEFVNECHNRGIAVILDIALNHSFGQNPMVRMYFNPDDGDYGAPTPDNPWFNQYPKHDFNVGYDFNHESQRTRDFSKRVMSYWMDEYHVDGYRFDLSKGFTQNNTLGNIGAWNAYDQSRVNIWNDYYSHMQSVEPGSYAILEHFANNDEETVLANAGMMLWGNLNHEYSEGSMGYASDLNWGSYQARGWNNPHLVTFAESHDEERLMYKNLEYGNSAGSYDITNLNTALARQELAHCLLIPIPGPKMIWQFGELGYDYSINYCENGTISDGCRTSPKPIRWDYQDVEARKHLFKVTGALNNLKKTQALFSTTNFGLDVGGFGKRIHLNGGAQNGVVVGNFNVTAINMVPGFQHTGTWYDYFTGTSFEVSDLNASFSYQPGEYHIYLDYSLPAPDLETGLDEIMVEMGEKMLVYPNPAIDQVNISFLNANSGNVKVEIFDMTGKLAHSESFGGMASGVQLVNLSPELPQGSYVVRISTSSEVLSKTLVISE